MVCYAFFIYLFLLSLFIIIVILVDLYECVSLNNNNAVRFYGTISNPPTNTREISFVCSSKRLFHQYYLLFDCARSNQCGVFPLSGMASTRIHIFKHIIIGCLRDSGSRRLVPIFDRMTRACCRSCPPREGMFRKIFRCFFFLG